MADFEQMLQSVLSDPEKMQQIMGLAQSFGQTASETGQPSASAPPSPSAPDPGAMQQVLGLLRQTGIDSHQKALLTALTPYMSSQRVDKLKKAMQAAKMAELASSMLNSGSLSGR